MSIEKIVIEECTLTMEGQEVKKTTFTREKYDGDFDKLILENLDSDDVEDFAENHLEMIREENCGGSYDPEDFDDESLIDELTDRGYAIIKCQTINDSFKLQKVKELMEL